ncbi:MAG TPA: helix-turn-helix transcriptional regulator [Pilimelia sp.]|nr:helix-turn-helix transcriptional regulator [Pilimelia sp.]
MPSLVRWGLSSDADLVFRTLVTMGPRSAGGLGVDLGLAARRVRDALAELRAVDAAVPTRDRTAGRPGIWLARPAGDVVAALRARRFRPVDPELQVRHYQEVVRSLAHQRRASGRTYSGPVPSATPDHLLGDGVRYFATRDGSRRRLAELVALERHEHLAINPEQAFEVASVRAANPLDVQLLERGVQLRVLGVPPADRDALRGDLALLDRPGCAYREAPAVPMKLIVIDHRVAIFPADPRDPDRGYLEVSQPAMVRTLVSMFDQRWAAASDPRRHAVPGGELTRRERHLVALLAQGHTDATAARRLQISARSVTNIMRSLMDRFGAENRFQLGLALGALDAARPPSLPSTATTTYNEEV